MQVTELPYGLPGKIFRSPMPYSPLYDPEGLVLDEFKENHIEIVVLLLPEEESGHWAHRSHLELYERGGYRVIHFPIPDLGSTGVGKLRENATKIIDLAVKGKNIVIHCHAGRDRTGLVGAAIAKLVFNFGGEGAVEWIRRYIPRALMVPGHLELILKV